MSETWIRPDITSANLLEITPPDYSLYQQPRVARRGGELGFFVKDGLDASVVPTKTCSTFENFLIRISLNKESFYFLNIYRPPSSSTPTFFEHFQSLLEDIHYTTEHTLDLDLTKSNNDNISNVHTTDAFSDHLSVSFTLNFLTPRSQNNAIKEKMKADLLASELIKNPSKEPDTLYKQYHTTLMMTLSYT